MFDNNHIIRLKRRKYVCMLGMYNVLLKYKMCFVLEK